MVEGLFSLTENRQRSHMQMNWAAWFHTMPTRVKPTLPENIKKTTATSVTNRWQCLLSLTVVAVYHITHSDSELHQPTKLQISHQARVITHFSHRKHELKVCKYANNAKDVGENRAGE